MACGKDKKECCVNNTAGQVESSMDYLVCTCMGVMYEEICSAIKSGKNTYDALSDSLGVGTGCNSCVQEVKEILKKKSCSGCCQS